jgi:NAD(P)-dependent dehydrogenase (short-subunit alcohol dehydrogenase family)
VGFSSIEIKVSYLKALRADSGDIDVHGRALQVGRRVAFAEAHARNPAGELVGHATTSIAVIGASKAAAWSATNSIRVRLRDQGTTVTALHVAFMDTEMTAAVQAPKADPRDIARQAADAIASGAPEVLADETTRTVKSQLSHDISALYAA